ncbi:flagellar hook-length control protein FliK [Komagataeibacter kakiaceti]|uniref:flagellar hook-length control protein FliK n=1 Tax=Komagataeibacter kakiaceti TaxID=943261 RepID=UPI00046FE400|nr:flagellar hook-length control protein FliK [Komagataeibacter kakiaceti]
MSLQVQGMQAWPALMLAQTVMPAQTTAPQGQKPVGTSSSSATGTAAASTMTSGSVQTGSMLSVTAALDTILAALSSASPAQSAPSAQTMPGATPSSLSPATVADGSVTPRAKQTQIASVSIPATNSLQPTQDSSTGTDTVSASAPTEMDTLLASIGQQATAPVMSQGSAVSSPLSGRTSPAALSTSSSATTPVAVSAQPAQASDGTTTPQQSQTAGVSNITVETSARADSRDSLASLATSPDHTASAGYNAVTAPTDGAGIVAGTEHQGNGLSDHSGTSEGERGDDAQQQAGTASPASMTLSTDLSAPSAFTLEHAGQTTDTQSVQAQTQTDEEDEAGNQILSSPGISRSADGQTSVSMTIMTADSTPVHVRLEGTDGITTGIVLQSEDEATARHLATNRHELVTALGATGMEVGNLKIDVVAATDNGANLTDQAPVAMPGMMAALQGACPATGPDRMGGSHSRAVRGGVVLSPRPRGELTLKAAPAMQPQGLAAHTPEKGSTLPHDPNGGSGNRKEKRQ